MKRFVLTLLCVCVLLTFGGCDFSTEPSSAETKQTGSTTTNVDSNNEQELKPTPYAEINSFDEKMAAHFGDNKPTMAEHGGSNDWIYDFGDFKVEVWVGSFDKSPRTLYLELSQTDTTDENFLLHAKEIFDVLLGNITDADFQTMMEYASGTNVLNDPGFDGKLSSITGVMCFERKVNSTETLYTVKCTYKEQAT